MQKPFRPPATVDIEDLCRVAWKLLRDTGVRLPSGERYWCFVVGHETYEQMITGVPTAPGHTLSTGGVVGAIESSLRYDNGELTLFGILVETSNEARDNVIFLRHERRETFRTVL